MNNETTFAPHSQLSIHNSPFIRPGYKQTEVGVIPEDWSAVPLGEMLRRAPSYGVNAPAIPSDSRFPVYIRITDITGEGRFSEDEKASVDHPDAEAYVLESGDLVFARTGASVGKSYLYDPKDGLLVFAGFLIRISPDSKRLLPGFLSQYVRSRAYWSWIKANSMRSGQPGVNGHEYACLPIPMPPTKAEQEAIAEALSDADALIESLEGLIAKKRQIKQGAMQELLTGKTRLPGFSGEWEEKSLGELADLYQPVTISARQLTATGFPVYGANGVVGFFGEMNHDTWQVIVTCRGSTCGTVNRTVNQCWITGNAMVLNCDHNEKLSKEFFYYLLSAQDLSICITGTGQPQIVRTPLADFSVPLPPTKPEQEAIASILSDMDAGRSPRLRPSSPRPARSSRE